MYIGREIKLRVAPERAAAARRLLARGRTNRLRSIYYDTPGRALQRAGASLRLRRYGARWLQTLKTDSGAQAGLAKRAEWETPLSGNALRLSAFPRQEILSTTGIDVAQLERLERVFETRFTRRSLAVKLGSGARAELALDRGAIVAGRRREPIAEIELELKSGAPRALLRYAEALELPLAFESKAERGYRLALGKAPAPRKWQRPELPQNAAAHEAFLAMFSAALAQAGANARGVAAGGDPEFLHQMRVGLRRLRSALRAFDIERPKALLRRLRRVMPALGAARDWDVFVAFLEAQRARRELVARARQKRAAARRAASDAAASRNFEQFLLRALRWAHELPGPGCELAALAKSSLERLKRKTRRHAAWRDAKERHALRIQVKRLRYACEFFGVPDPAVEKLQDLLGEL